jgi:hypothetical protein
MESLFHDFFWLLRSVFCQIFLGFFNPVYTHGYILRLKILFDRHLIFNRKVVEIAEASTYLRIYMYERPIYRLLMTEKFYICQTLHLNCKYCGHFKNTHCFNCALNYFLWPPLKTGFGHSDLNKKHFF